MSLAAAVFLSALIAAGPTNADPLFSYTFWLCSLDFGVVPTFSSAFGSDSPAMLT